MVVNDRNVPWPVENKRHIDHLQSYFYQAKYNPKNLVNIDSEYSGKGIVKKERELGMRGRAYLI